VHPVGAGGDIDGRGRAILAGDELGYGLEHAARQGLLQQQAYVGNASPRTVVKLREDKT